MTKAAFIVECPAVSKADGRPRGRAVIAHEAPPRKRSVAISTPRSVRWRQGGRGEERFRQARAAEADKGQAARSQFQESLKKAKDSPDPPRRPFDNE